jgi:hypothetical protein
LVKAKIFIALHRAVFSFYRAIYHRVFRTVFHRCRHRAFYGLYIA